VVTGEEVEFLLPEGVYVQEPQFIQRPGTSGEDDGILLTQGFDGSRKKGITACFSDSGESCFASVVAVLMVVWMCFLSVCVSL